MSKKIFCTLITLIFIVIFSVCVLGKNELPETPTLKDVDYYNQKANALLDSGKLKEAIDEYKKIEKMYPDNLTAYFNEGFALKQLGKYNEALIAFNIVLSKSPNSISVSYEIGDTYEKMNNITEAQNWYQKAVKMEPKSAMGYFNRGNALKKLGKENEAKEDFIKAYQMDPRFEYLEKQYPGMSTQNNDNNLKDENNFYDKFLYYLNLGYNKQILIIILLIIPIDTLLIYLNWKKRIKQEMLIRDTLDYIQGKLGMYTFKIENDEDIDYIDNTQRLIVGWKKEKVKECLEMLNNDYSKLDRNMASVVREILQKELDFRVFD